MPVILKTHLIGRIIIPSAASVLEDSSIHCRDDNVSLVQQTALQDSFFLRPYLISFMRENLQTLPILSSKLQEVNERFSLDVRSDALMFRISGDKEETASLILRHQLFQLLQI